MSGRDWLRTLVVGLRLSAAGGGPERARSFHMAAGFALAGALVLSALSIPTALARYSDREAQRLGIALQREDRNVRTATLRWDLGTDFLDRPVSVYAVAGSARSPVPPGIPRLPLPGQAFVSPALAQVLASPNGTLLRPRVPGMVVGRIAGSALLEPGELLAYVGPPPGLHLPRSRAEQVVAFAVRPSATAPLGPVGTVLLSVSVISVLVPLGLLIWTVSRVSATAQELRLARIRLLGATQQQARMIAASEILPPAIAGALLAAPIAWAARPLSIRILSTLVGHGFFAADVTPSLPLAAAALVGIPILSLAIALGALRRVHVSPLGVVRRARPPSARAGWPVILALGLLGLLACWLGREALLQLRGGLPAILVGVPLVSVSAALAGTAPFLIRLTAGWIAARGSAPSVLLGARRLEIGPGPAGRSAGALSTLLALAVVLEAIFASASSRGIPPGVAALDRADIVVHAAGVPPRQRSAFWHSVAQVRGVVGLETSRITPDGHRCGGARCVAVVHTDGRATTVERVRNVTDLVAASYTADFLRAERSGWGNRAVRLLMFGALFVMLVTAGSMLTTSIDGILERRRALAALRAIGVPSRVIAGSLFWQSGLPVVVGLLLAIPTGSAVAAMLFAIADRKVVLPVALVGITSVAGVALTLGVVALSLPWIRSIRDPSLLRAE